MVTVTNSTFSGNRANDGGIGGAIDDDGGTVDIKGTILAGSTGGNCGGSAFTDNGYNISDDGSCMFSTTSTSVNNTNPDFSSDGLTNNGGPTYTIALELISTSPAINRIPPTLCTYANGAQLTTDQRCQRRSKSTSLGRSKNASS